MRLERWAARAAGLAVICGLLVVACSAAAVSGAAGRFVYVAATKRNEVSQFKVSRSGALGPLKPATVSSGAFPYGIAVSPQGTSVYAVDVGANKVSQYTIDRVTGRLRAKSPATVPTGRGPESIAISPDGKSV
jgi:6-phosphogluconolactonase (cycloisomerase 2 family)